MGRGVASGHAGSPADPRNHFYWWVIGLAAVLGILLHESLFFGRGLVPADGVLSNPPWNSTNTPGNYLLADQFSVLLPQHEFMYQQFRQGHFPLWNPRLNCGVPNIASFNGALLFPVSLLLLPFDPFYAGGVAAFLKLFLAGWFTMLYLRLLGANDAAAFLSGLVFSLSGFMIVWLGHPQVNCAMWLPMLLYFVEKSFLADSGPPAGPLTGPAVRAAIGFAFAYGFMLLGGHPPTAIQITIVVLVYFIFRWMTYRRKPLRCVMLLAGALAVGCFLAAPQWLPFLEYYRHSSSAVASNDLQRWSERLTPNTLIHFLLPHLSGSPAEGFEDLPKLLGLGTLPNFNERTGYVGILPLLCALFAVTGRRCAFTFFYVALILGALLVIYGVPPMPDLLRVLPVLRDINETRLLLFVGFGLAVLAGLGWDNFSRWEDRCRTRWTVPGFWAAVGVAMFWLWNVIGHGFHELDSARRTFLVVQFFVLGGGLLASGVLMMKSTRWSWVPTLVCLGWTAADLLWFGMGYNPAIPRGHYYPKTPAIEWLEKDPSVFRIFGGGTTFIPNTAEVFGFDDVRGCDFMNVRRYEELITGRAGDFNFYAAASRIPPAFPLLNAKYLLFSKPLPMNPAWFDLVYSNEVFIYRFRACAPRVFLVSDYEVNRDPAANLARARAGNFDPQRLVLLEEEPLDMKKAGENTPVAADLAASVRITSYEPDEVCLEASAPRPEFLVLLDTYFSGWTASVNGQPARIYRADYNFRALIVPKGKATVRFVYRPHSFQIGLALAAAGLLVLGAAWFWSSKRAA